MARITVEDCLVKIPNRFQLVLAATYRARMLSQGHAPKIETKNKPGVTALREIAAGEIGIEMLKQGSGLAACGLRRTPAAAARGALVGARRFRAKFGAWSRARPPPYPRAGAKRRRGSGRAPPPSPRPPPTPPPPRSPP